MDTAASLSVSAIPVLRPKHVLAVVVGNALEFYDFMTYAFFAIHIGHCFFPSDTQGASLLKSLATFGVGFLTRPLGGILIGRMGDRLGRKPAMQLSFALMGTAIVGLALTPSYDQIGLAAPALVVFFRLVQGFALGGEIGPATSFLVEASPPRRRGLLVSFQSASQNLAILGSSLIGYGLTRVLDPVDLDRYGWRIAFLLGAVVVPLGIWIRRTLPETLLHVAPEGGTTELGSAPPRTIVLLGGMWMASMTIATYIQSYMTTYAISSLHMNEGVAFVASIIGAVCGFVVGPAMAAVSDRLGRRKPFLVYPAILRLAATFPIFWLIIHFPGAAALFVGSALLGTLGAASPGLVAISEALPRRMRAGAFGALYALIISAFGGTTQFAVQALIDWTGSPLAPAWYLSVAMVIGLIASFSFPETAPRPDYSAASVSGKGVGT